jgi:hypothetical protein
MVFGREVRFDGDLGRRTLLTTTQVSAAMIFSAHEFKVAVAHAQVRRATAESPILNRRRKIGKNKAEAWSSMRGTAATWANNSCPAK